MIALLMKSRIQVYTDYEMKRRIELAATQSDIPVTQYCFEAIVQRLQEDSVLDQEKIEVPVSQAENDKQLIADLRALHQEIQAHRQGKPPIDVEKVIDEMYEEQEYDILGLR